MTGDGVALALPRRRHPAASLRGADQYPDDPYHKLLEPQPTHKYITKDWPPKPANYYVDSATKPSTRTRQTPYTLLGLETDNTNKSQPIIDPDSFSPQLVLGERPNPDYKYDPVPTLGGPIDPFLVAHTDPPPTLFKYERDGPIPDVTPIQTPLAPGPNTLTGFPPIFHKHVPGYLFDRNRHAEDFKPKTYFVDYVRRREMGGCSV